VFNQGLDHSTCRSQFRYFTTDGIKESISSPVTVHYKACSDSVAQYRKNHKPSGIRTRGPIVRVVQDRMGPRPGCHCVRSGI